MPQLQLLLQPQEGRVWNLSVQHDHNIIGGGIDKETGTHYEKSTAVTVFPNDFIRTENPPWWWWLLAHLMIYFLFYLNIFYQHNILTHLLLLGTVSMPGLDVIIYFIFGKGARQAFAGMCSSIEKIIKLKVETLL